MRRVSASEVLLLLHQETNPRCHITATTLRTWVHRGHITRGPGGYDLREILTYIEARERPMHAAPKTYRKKPVEVQAMQWAGDNVDEMIAWMGSGDFTELHGSMRAGDSCTAQIWVDANKQWLRIETGEWVIRDSKGFYPCKPDIFAATYEAA